MSRVVSFAALIVMLLLSAPAILAIGYGPVTVQGSVTRGGVAVNGAEVSLKAFIDGIEVASSDPIVTVNGEFYAVVTVPDPSTADVQLTVRSGEVYVELLKDAQPWMVYFLEVELENEQLGVAPRSAQRVAPTTPEEDADLNAIADGTADPDVFERTDAIVDDAQPAVPAAPADDDLLPVVEQPRTTQSWLDLAAVVAMVLFLAVLAGLLAYVQRR